MATKKTVQKDNLNSGQWSQLFGFDESEVVASTQTTIIDTDNTYYSTQRQIELQKNRKFRDRSQQSILSGTTKAINFFYSETKKETVTKNGYLSGSVIDKYRQGVEITQPKHWQSGFNKISAGTPGHIINPFSYGIAEQQDLTGNDYFQELSLFNPIEFISVQGTDKLIENVITFPIVTSDVNVRENTILNGIIEPFPIRPIISQFSINFPFEPQGISANFGNGNTHLRISTDDVISVYSFEPKRVNKKVFLDGGDPIIVKDDSGQTQVEVGQNLAFISMDQNLLEPFADVSTSRGDELLTTSQYESDLLAVIKQMKSQNTTYLTVNEVSARTGFDYNNSIQGIDSIAYGGLTR